MSPCLVFPGFSELSCSLCHNVSFPLAQELLFKISTLIYNLQVVLDLQPFSYFEVTTVLKNVICNHYSHLQPTQYPNSRFITIWLLGIQHLFTKFAVSCSVTIYDLPRQFLAVKVNVKRQICLKTATIRLTAIIKKDAKLGMIHLTTAFLNKRNSGLNYNYL